MASIAQETFVAETLQRILNERARAIARETGWVQRERKFTGASLVQTVVFGWQQHPEATLEQLASTAASGEVVVSDTAIDDRFTPQGAETLRRVLEELSAVVIQAGVPVEVALFKQFEAVILEDSSIISLPPSLAPLWEATGNQHTEQAAALKLHVRWELVRGRLDGPALTAGKTGDQSSPWAEVAVETNTLSVQDLGYFNVWRMVQRRAAGAYSLSRLRSRTSLFDRQGTPLCVRVLAPKQVGQSSEMAVLVGSKQRHLMRLLLLKVPWCVARERREHLQEEAKRRGQPVSQEAWDLADWTILLTDAPARN